jgi:oxygen-independent coproporphyrinogen-3 oxidase
MSESKSEPTTVGNYFVSNYPPYSFWSEGGVPEAEAALHRAPAPDVPLGLYIHIPFCRKRCDFCYFKVYTDKNGSEVRRYVDGVLAELELYMDLPFMAGRTPSFVYFGGGTPSYLSTGQLRHLFEGLQERLPWTDTKEVAFECEPGTLQEGKAALLRELGATRLSLGIENFDQKILELNNRAHGAPEIDRAYGFMRDEGFEQVNVDLIAGMVGETEENWRSCIDRTIALAPESVTIYQMEVPYNTTIYQDMKDGGKRAAPVADWETKRRWVSEAFARLEDVGYKVGSAYTAVRGDEIRFLYRDALWHGADMLGLGVSSFSHIDGVHFQNEHSFEPYLQRVEAGERPILRGHALTDEERFVRELILQMKLGHLRPAYFAEKFGVDIRERYSGPLARLAERGIVTDTGDRLELSRAGLLQIDGLLPDFFLDEHRNARYA